MAAYNLYVAKTSLSRLVEQAVGGEEVIIAKAGRPMVKLVPIQPPAVTKRVFGRNDLGVTYIAPDFDDPIWNDEELEEMGLA